MAQEVPDGFSLRARMIARAIEGSEGERKYARTMRRLKVQSAIGSIAKVMLPVDMNLEERVNKDYLGIIRKPKKAAKRKAAPE